MTQTKALLVTRHNLTDYQKELLAKANIEIVERTDTVPTNPSEFRQFINNLKQKGISTVVTTALPINVVIQLYNAGLTVYTFKQEPYINKVVSKEEAEKILKELPEEERKKIVLVPSIEGNVRIMKTVGLFKIKRIEIEEEKVAE